MFAVLAHDFGKPSTTQHIEKNGKLRWTSAGHATASGPLAESFLRRIGAPLGYDRPVRALVENHHAHDRGNLPFTDRAVRRLALRLVPATIYDLAAVMSADARGRPPISPRDADVRIAGLLGKAESLKLESLAPRPILQGRHLVVLGHKPGPRFKPLLDAAFEAQLDGAFADEAGGVDWLRRRLQETGDELR
jgi:tRNA nucleotidyltransferase (CCA-adding enzyme)